MADDMYTLVGTQICVVCHKLLPEPFQQTTLQTAEGNTDVMDVHTQKSSKSARCICHGTDDECTTGGADEPFDCDCCNTGHLLQFSMLSIPTTTLYSQRCGVLSDVHVPTS